MLRPMLAMSASEPFDSAGHLFEVNWDGVRALLHVDAGDSRLVSRRGADLSHLFPELTHLRDQVTGRSVVLDGEVIIPDRQGRPRMDHLRRRLSAGDDAARVLAARYPAAYQVFDVLWAGESVMDRPLEDRRALLQNCAVQGGSLLLPAPFEENGVALYDEVVSRNLEGVVAKRRGSAYHAGARSFDWLKVKRVRDGEFVIGGYTIGGGRRKDYLSGILLGYVNEGGLHYCGRVVGGFDREERELLGGLERLHAAPCPFVTEPRTGEITFFVTPEMVAQVRHAGWRADGTLSFPVFMTLRPDVPADECRQEEVVDPPE